MYPNCQGTDVKSNPSAGNAPRYPKDCPNNNIDDRGFGFCFNPIKYSIVIQKVYRDIDDAESLLVQLPLIKTNEAQ